LPAGGKDPQRRRLTQNCISEHRAGVEKVLTVVEDEQQPYAVLAVQQSDELAAWTTDIFLVAIGAAAAVVAYRAAAREKLELIS
jgi:hypothetical protein